MEVPSFIDSLSPDIAQLKEFPSSAPFELPENSDDYYRLSHNEAAYGASPKVIEAVQKSAPFVGMYPAMRDDELREKLVDTYSHGLTIENFFTGCSGYETLDLTTRAFLRAGDEMITMQPTFSVYNRFTQLTGATMINVPLSVTDFTPNIDALLAAITPKTRIIMLSNPNNPTGTMMTQAQMTQLMENIPDHVLVISDEVYFHYVTDDNYPNTMQYVENKKNIVLIHTFSKGYGLAGMRIGYGIAPAPIASYIRKFNRGYHLNALQLVAAKAALEDVEHLEKNVDAGIKGREYFYQEFDRLDLRYWESQSNFVLVELPCDAAKVSEHMLKQNVMVRIVSPKYPNHLRISASTLEGNQACIQALENALQEVMK